MGVAGTNKFNLPIALDEGTLIRIAYGQKLNGENEDATVYFVKETKDCIIDGKTVFTNVSEKEALMFDWRHDALMQISVLLPGASAPTNSNIIIKSVPELLDKTGMTFNVNEEGVY